LKNVITAAEDIQKRPQRRRKNCHINRMRNSWEI